MCFWTTVGPAVGPGMKVGATLGPGMKVGATLGPGMKVEAMVGPTVGPATVGPETKAASPKVAEAAPFPNPLFPWRTPLISCPPWANPLPEKEVEGPLNDEAPPTRTGPAVTTRACCWKPPKALFGTNEDWAPKLMAVGEKEEEGSVNFLDKKLLIGQFVVFPIIAKCNATVAD